MVQKRFINYKASVDSFPLGEQHLGVFKPGRYNGFDEMVAVDNQTLDIKHEGKITKSDADGTGVNLYGVLITPTGTVIHQEGKISVNLPTNSAPPFEEEQKRTFILICEHNYQAVKGGVEASYFLIANPDSGTEPIELPNNRSQVILGVITKNYHNNSLSYVPSRVPNLGDQDARDIYDKIKEFISIPEAEALPDFDAIAKKWVEANKPKVIVTGAFDTGNGPDSTTEWQSLGYTQYVINNLHNVKGHQVHWRRVKINKGQDFIDIEVVRNLTHTGTPWEAGAGQVQSALILNESNAGGVLYQVEEVTNHQESGPNGKKVFRFKLQETGGSTQRNQLKIVLYNINTVTPQEEVQLPEPGDIIM